MSFWLIKCFLAPLVWLYGRPVIEGAEHVPAHGPVILASNHLAVADSFFLVLIMRRRVSFVAKNEYFTGRGLKGIVTRWFVRATGQVPIDRSSGSAAQGALDAAIKILKDGGVWGIYPEGTRSPDGRLHKGKTGVIRVALETGAPVVPVVMTGTERINPPGTRRWRFGKVRIRICPALDFSRYQDFKDNRLVVRSATDELMLVLANNSGQEYVDRYAADVKAQLKAECAEPNDSKTRAG
jgi:1-acyl-sn-glycerol-3-phosphate acyltransferase